MAFLVHIEMLDVSHQLPFNRHYQVYAQYVILTFKLFSRPHILIQHSAKNVLINGYKRDNENVQHVIFPLRSLRSSRSGSNSLRSFCIWVVRGLSR